MTRIKSLKTSDRAIVRFTVRPLFGTVGEKCLKEAIERCAHLNVMTFGSRREMLLVRPNVQRASLKQYICQLILGGNVLEGDMVPLV